MPNGEYSKAFADKQDANIYTVNIEAGDEKKQLEIPLWFGIQMNGADLQASPKTHRTTILMPKDGTKLALM